MGNPKSWILCWNPAKHLGFFNQLSPVRIEQFLLEECLEFSFEMVKNEDSKKFFPPSFVGYTTLPEFSVKYEIYWYSANAWIVHCYYFRLQEAQSLISWNEMKWIHSSRAVFCSPGLCLQRVTLSTGLNYCAFLTLPLYVGPLNKPPACRLSKVDSPKIPVV